MCIYIHAYMYIYMYYIYRCFCNELKVFIEYLLKKKQTHSFPRCPFLSPLKLVFLPPSLFLANGQAALNVGRILW